MRIFTVLSVAIIILLIPTTSFCQQYQVIRIVGHVLNGEDTLRVEDKLNYSDELTFINGDDQYSAAAVINSRDMRRYVLKHSDDSPGPQIGILAENLHASRVERGPRSYYLHLLEHLEILFSRPTIGIFDGKLDLFFGAHDTLLNNENYLFVTYQFKGEEIRKRIPYEDRYLRFSAVELFQIDGVPFSPEEATDFELKYYRTQDDSVRSIAKFQPIFPKSRELAKEIDEMVDQISIFDDRHLRLLHDLKFQFGSVEYDNAAEWVAKYLSKK